jgi:hypothetical protein
VRFFVEAHRPADARENVVVIDLSLRNLLTSTVVEQVIDRLTQERFFAGLNEGDPADRIDVSDAARVGPPHGAPALEAIRPPLLIPRSQVRILHGPSGKRRAAMSPTIARCARGSVSRARRS